MYEYKKMEDDTNMLFFHGTHAFFDQFEDHYRGSNTAWDNTVHGFFFSSKKENVLMFGDTVVTAHLDIRNPLDLRIHSIFNEESQAPLIWEIGTGEKLDNPTALQTLYNEISLGELGEMHDALNNEDAHNMMVEAGYDGIISDFGKNIPEYVVFTASQIDILSIDRPLSMGRGR